MPIIRTRLDHEDNFTQIPNAWLRDNRLSLKAIGLLAQLLSHSQGWSVSVETLARSNNCGKDLVRSAITELEQHGYLTRKQTRNGNLFGESVFYTTAPDLSLAGFPTSENTTSENPTPKNKSIKKNIDKKYLSSKFELWFEEFWEAYPRKVGKSAAYKAFMKLGEVSAHAVAGARRLANDPNLPPEQYIPHPTTWLNRSGWQDDPYPAREKSKEELADLARETAQDRRAKDLEANRKLLAQIQEAEKNAAPMPLCEHGNKLVFCRICLAKGDTNG